VVRTVETLVDVLVAVTVALGTTAPVGSCTVPAMAPVPESCARATPPKSPAMTSTTAMKLAMNFVEAARDRCLDVVSDIACYLFK
jgi:hypothetical protein